MRTFNGPQFGTELTAAFNFVGHLGSKSSTVESTRRDGRNLSEALGASMPDPMTSITWTYQIPRHYNGGGSLLGFDFLMSSAGLGKSEKDLEPINELTVDELLSAECIIGGTSQMHLINGAFDDDVDFGNVVPTTVTGPPNERLPHQCETDVDDCGLNILYDLFEQSYHKLCRSFILAATPNLKEFLSDSQALVTTALEVLRKVLCWKYLPTAGIEVYAVLHFAYASALYANPRNMCTMHDKMYADVSRWSLVVDSKDRTLFRTIFSQIWCPQEISVGATSWTDVMNETDENHGQGVNLPHVPTESTRRPLSLDQEEFCISPKTFDQDSNVSLDSLLGGIAILMCRQYLDGKFAA